MNIKSPGDYIQEELHSRGWTQSDFAKIIGRPLPTINQIIKGKHGIQPEMAISISEALGDSPELWMERESTYRLSLVEPQDSAISKRAKLYEIAPIKDMMKRGWLKKTDEIEELQAQVLAFFGISNVDEEPKITAAMRKSEPHNPNLTPAQKAWCFRIRQMAKLAEAKPYDDSKLAACEKKLRKLAAYPKEARKVPKVLADHGIRFVVVEPITGTKSDGATLWLDDDSPVIGMSVRYDRIDNFWFTLFHELSHVRHRDLISVDCDITGTDDLMNVKPPFELRADREASSSLIPDEEMKSFILRNGPMYREDQIVRFAHVVKIHPGVIVGQLHGKGEMNYRSHRKFLSNVRESVISESFTDGWGQSF